MTYQVGDRVTLIEGRYSESRTNPLGVEGAVTMDDYPGGEHVYQVEWENGYSNCYTEGDLAVLTKGTPKRKGYAGWISSIECGKEG